MKNIQSEDKTYRNSNTHPFRKINFRTYDFGFMKRITIYIIIIIIILIYEIIYKKIKKNKNFKLQKEEKRAKNNISLVVSKIDLSDEFFDIKSVKEQIKNKNLTYIETLSGGYGNVGNALIMLNNLINICEKIRCKNIIAPGGLQSIIKKPIFYKEYNITIYPNNNAKKINVDILLTKREAFWFGYKRKRHHQRLKIIRDEVLNNIPKYNSNINDLYINIRSGDIFINRINKMYSQPPLCFYQKIINDNNYNDIYILSNGHENPVVDELIKLYPHIKYIHGSIIFDISVLINAYNLVMPISTFTFTLINLNNNLMKLYYYDLLKIPTKNVNYTIYKMNPSDKYKKLMEKKWKKSKEQLELMINENCTKSEFEIIIPIKK